MKIGSWAHKFNSAYSHPEYAFLGLAAIFGLLFLYTTPVLRVPDEQSHLERAFQISDLSVFPSRTSVGIGGRIPTSIALLGPDVQAVTIAQMSLPRDSETYKLESESIRRGSNGTPHSTLYQLIKALGGRHLNSSERTDQTFANTAIYSPVMYLPQAAGIMLGRAVNAAPVLIVIFGRLVNLAAFIALVFFAVRYAPFGRWAFACLALTPIAIQQAASFSPDAITSGLAFLSIALSLRIITQDSLPSKRQWWAVYVVAGLLGLCKQPMFLLPTLLLARSFVGKQDRKQYYSLAAGALALSCMLGLLWTVLSQPFFSPAHAGVLIDPAAQASSILHHPLAYLKDVLRTWWSNWSDNYIVGYIGTMGWLELPLRSYTVVAGYFVLFWALLTSGVGLRARITKWQRILSGTLFFILLLATMTLLYLSWNAVGATMIDGVQARYFIPFAPLLILVFANHEISLRRGDLWTNRIAVFGTVFVLATALVQMAQYYY